MNKTRFALLVVALTGLLLGNLYSDSAVALKPKIEGYGKVRQFPTAEDQPRDGSRIVVDLTAGGDRDKLSPGIEKLARFVNIYAAAGKAPAGARISVVMHGDATQNALNDEAYRDAFQVEKNPNLELMRILKGHGVDFVVCGQSLTSKGFEPGQVAAEVKLAVSGLTALTNRQQDGYSYVPMSK